MADERGLFTVPESIYVDYADAVVMPTPARYGWSAGAGGLNQSA
jgi:hypothetical protein